MWSEAQAEVFWLRVVKGEPDECWLWSAAVDGNGYGRFLVGMAGQNTVAAHRLAFEIASGQPVPTGWYVTHRCRVHACCNPAHLELTHTTHRAESDEEFALRFWSRVTRSSPNECWEWIGNRLKQGYGQIWRQGRNSTLAHRTAYELGHDVEVPKGQYVLHSCDNPACCNPSHLRVGSIKDNVNDAIERGQWPHRVALSDEQRAVITEELGRGVKGTSLARRYGVHSTTIYRLKPKST